MLVELIVFDPYQYDFNIITNMNQKIHNAIISKFQEIFKISDLYLR